MLKIQKYDLKERILAVYATNEIYIGLGSKLYNFNTKNTIYTHEKSIRHINGNDAYIGTASYDGKSIIINKKTEEIIEVIEGPDTEIKGIEIYDKYIFISTRGKTVWILEDFEISKILEDHTQDVKGNKIWNGRLYTWSYDGYIKVYELFDEENSWEMVESIEVGNIIWGVVFCEEKMYASTEDGELVMFEMENNLYREKKRMRVSKYPIFCICVIGITLCIVVDRNLLVLMDLKYEVIETIVLNNCEEEGVIEINGEEAKLIYEITCISYSAENKQIVCGSENGILYLINVLNY